MNHKLNQSKTCIDLYSGIGGWALGFKLCGVDIKQSFEWWSQASKTHDLNLLSNTTNCDIRELSHNNITDQLILLLVVLHVLSFHILIGAVQEMLKMV